MPPEKVAVIEILTLFAGLVSGPQEVALRPAETVAAVEVRLDGRPAGTLSRPPWTLEVDLGAGLAPHELLAVARDRQGRELGRDRRWINLEATAPALPEGTGAAAEEDTLTPVAVRFAPGQRNGLEMPGLEAMGSWFFHGDQPLAVRAVTAGPAEVVVVRDPAVEPLLEDLSRLSVELALGGPRRSRKDWDPEVLRRGREGFLRRGGELFALQGAAAEPTLGRAWEAFRAFASLGEEAEVRFLNPLAAPVSHNRRSRQVFLQSVAASGVGLVWFADKVPPMSSTPRFADAVAVAGLEARATGRPRAVVLLVWDEPTDHSRYAPAAARRYLEALQVPLRVWSFVPRERFAGWGEPRAIGFAARRRNRIRSDRLVAALGGLEAAVTELRQTLDSQRIVWLEGRHLPQNVRLSAAAGARLAGGDGPEAR